MKKWNLIILMLLMLPLVTALIDCKDIETPNDIPCVIRSTWDYSNCSTTEVKIYNSTPSLISTRNFTDYGDSGRCNITWNITEKGSYFWNISNGDTGSLIVRDENMELAMIIGLGIVIITLLYIAFHLDKTHLALKILLTVFSIFLLLLIPSMLLNGVSATADNFFKAMMLIIKIFSGYLFIYLNYVFWLKSKFINWGFIKQK